MHFIPISEDFSDVKTKLEWARSNEALAQAIADRGRTFIETRLRTSNVVDYWDRLLRRYSDLQTFRPSLAGNMTLLFDATTEQHKSEL